MKKINKLVIMVMVFSFVFSISSIAALANNFSNSQTEETATSSFENNMPSLDRYFFDSAEMFEEDGVVYLTRDYQMESRSNNDLHVKETIYIVPSEDSTAEEISEDISEFFALASTPGNKYESNYDGSYSVMGYTTIYYERQTINDVPFALLTNISGGYTILDNQVRVNFQSIESGCTGWAIGHAGITQTDDFGETSSSWSHDSPSDWVYVATNDTTHYVGGNCTYTLQRVGSASTWTFVVENKI